MKTSLLYLTFIFQLFPNLNSYSLETILTMHVRDRYPEIVIENNKFTGPLIDIINEAADNIGIKIEFIEAPFTRTLIDLENGKVDLCPRFSKTAEREEFAYFLGPISRVNKIVYFIVPKGQEKIIKNYDDLKKYPVAIKRGTHYFEKFNKDNSIHKLEYKDDENMSLMFMNKRFKVIAIRDYLALIRYFEKNNFKDYTKAIYRHEEIDDIFYGMSKKSPHLDKKEVLNKVLNKMRIEGRIKKIYEKYGIKD
jgi:polar amino acid transport system substrate-binding protein